MRLTKKYRIRSKLVLKTSKLFFMYGLLAIFFSGCKTGGGNENQIYLAGEWRVRLDSLHAGAKENWSASLFEGQKIELPGTLDEAGIGEPNTLQPALNNYVLSNLARKHQYIGKAWYQREVTVPESWSGKKIILKLERVLWQSNVYVDGKSAGSAESLVGSHNYDLSELLSPGKHLLTIAIDNSNQYPLINVKGNKYPDPVNQDMAHAYTNHTQIKWNGILGDILLESSASNSPANLQVYPDAANNRIKISFEQEGPAPKNIRFELQGRDGHLLHSEIVPDPVINDGKINFQILNPRDLQTWDEFNPQLYIARIISSQDTLQTRFGYKEVKHDDAVLTLNGKRIFLRGNLECAIFPLTGHPPMEKEAWANLINQAKDYGLNHLRFHSWCPPKAAFEAADEAGFYLQVELPHWSLKVGQDNKTTDFLRQEANKILTDYGNHPSFIMMSLGNELQGDIDLLNKMVQELKQTDNRHLYATTSFSFQRPAGSRPEPEDEFFITQKTNKGWIRGQGIFNAQPSHFDKDYSINSDHIDVPLISHEIGQYSVYPDLSEIPEYTGVLEPLNFIAIKNDLEKKGLIDLADDFTHASGRLAAMLYKEEIERALKTPNFDGFQLLQLQDFPGQGTALVGLLNAFWQSKGIISAEEFREFNGPLVPLLRFEKAVYESGETFVATIEVANFLEDKKAQDITWSVRNEQNEMIAEGSLAGLDIPIGNGKNLGSIEVPVKVEKAQRWIVELSLSATDHKNHWPVWVFPKSNIARPEDMLETTSFEAAISALKQGKKVFLNPDPNDLKGIKGRFVPVFWSPVHFPDQPGTMGLLIDDQHKALDDFPTRSYSEWQWWDLCINSKAVAVDLLNIQPIVRVIDNFVRNKHLANIFEVKIGEGKLLFSSIDLQRNLDKRPAARQLRNSLLNYMATENFNPSESISAGKLRKLKKIE